MFREDWEETKETLYTQKQGKHTRDQKETTILRVKDLKSYIEKMASSKTDLKHLNDGKEIEICLDLDAGAGRVVAEFGILSDESETLKIHPFLIYEGTDVRPNLEIALGGLTEQIRNLEGKEVTINGEIVKIKMYALFDLCALNCLVGKQNHSSTFPCAWTSVSKDHLQNHSGNEHIPSKCQDIKFLSMEEYERNLTHHLVGEGGKSSAKAGKNIWKCHRNKPSST